MCGITGCWALAGDRNEDTLRALATHMADQLRHRGPDAEGVWVDSEAGIAFGHRRLAIIDLTVEGMQPMHSATGRYVLCYNGEIYNFQSLRHQLEQFGHRFRGHSDTEVMLAAFEQWGVQPGVERFVGMFAFALWDRQERCLYLVRDRLGEKPLYYGWMDNTFLFGSELKALRAHPSFQAEVNRDALALFLQHMVVPTPYSIYVGIHKLPPASILKISTESHAAEPIFYWSASHVAEQSIRDPFTGGDGEAIDMLDKLLREAVRRQMVADVPLGAFLSGGIDSSTIVALMQSQSDRPVRTFTIGFQESKYNEAEYAKAIAVHLKTDHTELYVTAKDALNVIPLLPAIYDEPFADSSQIPTYLVARMARQHVTVSLSGDGGDELFAGYAHYYKWQNQWSKIGHIPPFVRYGTSVLLSALTPEGWATMLRPVQGLLPSNPQRIGHRLHTLADVLKRDVNELYLRQMTHWRDANGIVISSVKQPTTYTDGEHWPHLSSFFEQMLYVDMVAGLPDDMLVKVDRASMAVSLETRVPLLDHRLVEFIWRLPLNMKVRNGTSKWLLRQVLFRYVPRQLIERPKMGFGVPIDSWLRGPLREWAEDLLNETSLRQQGYFKVEAIRQKWHEHLNKTQECAFLLWDVLMFQSWLLNQQ